MKRTIYTANDIHQLGARGEKVLHVGEADVLTSVAKEAAELLGIKISHGAAPAGPGPEQPSAAGGASQVDLGSIKERLARETARVLNGEGPSGAPAAAQNHGLPGGPAAPRTTAAAPAVPHLGNLRTQPGRAKPFCTFLDTADVAQLRDAVSTGLVDGIATNPNKIAESGKSYRQVLSEIRRFFEGPIAFQALGRTTEEICRHALEIHRMDPLLAVKVAANKAGLSALQRLIPEGVRTNATLIFNPAQGLLAGLAGSPFISPFIGRANMAGGEGIGAIGQIRQMYDALGIEGTCIIGASIKDVTQVIEVILAGAHAIAIPFAVFEAMMEHPLTTAGLEGFLERFKTVPA